MFCNGPITWSFKFDQTVAAGQLVFAKTWVHVIMDVTGYIFPNIFRIFRTFSTLVISTFYAFPAMFSTSFIMFIPTHMANLLI